MRDWQLERRCAWECEWKWAQLWKCVWPRVWTWGGRASVVCSGCVGHAKGVDVGVRVHEELGVLFDLAVSVAVRVGVALRVQV